MVVSDDTSELAFRLAMAERAIQELRRRVVDLSQSLAAVTGQATPPPANALTIDAAGISEFYRGFHPSEQDGDGRPFRWTGNTDFFELRCHLDRNYDWQFRMMIRFPPNLADAELLAFADFIPIPIQVNRGAGLVTGVVPRQPFANQLALTFHCNRHFSPQAADPQSNDTRRLALSFYEIALTPRAAADAAPADAMDADAAAE